MALNRRNQPLVGAFPFVGSIAIWVGTGLLAPSLGGDAVVRAVGVPTVVDLDVHACRWKDSCCFERDAGPGWTRVGHSLEASIHGQEIMPV